MRINVTCFGAMREFLPPTGDGRSAEVEVAEGGSVADVVTALAAPAEIVHAILVNDEPARLDSHLSDGDRLTLMPHYSGG